MIDQNSARESAITIPHQLLGCYDEVCLAQRFEQDRQTDVAAILTDSRTLELHK